MDQTQRKPVKGFTAAASVLGMSDDTLRFKRKKYGDKTREAWWRDEDAVREWYERLIASLPANPDLRRRPSRQTAELGAAVDPRKVARELAGGSR